MDSLICCDAYPIVHDVSNFGVASEGAELPGSQEIFFFKLLQDVGCKFVPVHKVIMGYVQLERKLNHVN